MSLSKASTGDASNAPYGIAPVSPARGAHLLTWLERVVAAAGIVVVGWVTVTSWGAILHGYPVYGPLLLATVIGSIAAGWHSVRRRSQPTGWARVAVLLAAAGWVALMFWLRPFPAVEPALTAMVSDQSVRVSESATKVVLTPTHPSSTTAVFFQPGAKVEARAYAAVLRPLAESGHTVVIAKQPLGIAFLALPAFEAARRDHPEITQWVVAGHSLGGTVAAMEANSGDQDGVAGLLLYASYPAGDISTSLDAPVLSLSGSRDGLATPAKIDAARADLPADTRYTVIDGAVHAYFGDYGAQPGDGVPTITHDSARIQISVDSVRFVSELAH
jgi:Alpha/beta hydrolase family